jgi:hypothetical protein
MAGRNWTHTTISDRNYARISPNISSRIRSLRIGWRNSLVDRLKNHSDSYGLRRIGQTVKSDDVQNWIGQTVTDRNELKLAYSLD